MTEKKHTIRLCGPGTHGTRVSALVLRQLLDVLVDGMQRALRLRVEGRSVAPGMPPAWLDRACSVDLVGTRDGSSVLDLAAPSLFDAAPEQFSQMELFVAVDASRTAVDVLTDGLADALAGNRDSDHYDDALIDTFEGFGKLFRYQIDRIDIDGPTTASVTPASLEVIRELRRNIPPPQRSMVAGKLDQIRHSDRVFTVVLDDGGTVRGVVAGDAITPAELAAHFGKNVVVEGQAHFRPSGSPLRIDADRIASASASDIQLFSAQPQPLSSVLDVRSLQRSQGGRTGVAALFGQWPGDETDEEFEAAVREMD